MWAWTTTLPQGRKMPEYNSPSVDDEPLVGLGRSTATVTANTDKIEDREFKKLQGAQALNGILTKVCSLTKKNKYYNLK